MLHNSPSHPSVAHLRQQLMEAEARERVESRVSSRHIDRGSPTRSPPRYHHASPRSLRRAANALSTSSPEVSTATLKGVSITSPKPPSASSNFDAVINVLEERLALSMKAYDDEHAAHRAAQQRLRELAALADASAHLAEEVDESYRKSTADLAVARQHADDAELTLESVSKERSALLEEGAALRASFKDEERQRHLLEARLSQSESEVDSLRRENDHLRRQREQNLDEISRLSNRLAESVLLTVHEEAVSKLKQTIALSEVERSDIQARARANEADQAVLIQRYRDNLNDLNTERDVKIREIDMLQADLSKYVAATQDMEARRQMLLRDLDASDVRNRTLQSQLSETLNRSDAFERELAAERDSHRNMSARVRSALIDLEASDTDRESRRLLERQNYEMEHQLTELRVALHSLSRSRE